MNYVTIYPMTLKLKERDPVQAARQLEANRRWRKNNPEAARYASRKHSLKRYHGMTPEDFSRKEANQGGQCVICQRVLSLVVDHDHATGLTRGLLCKLCNAGLGCFEDNVEWLKRSAVYIAKWRLAHTGKGR